MASARSQSSREVPPSPRHLLQPSLALNDAISGAFSFASISAASFSAVTAPSYAPQRLDVPSSRGRYNTRSTSRMTEKENENPSSTEDQTGRVDAHNRHQRHALPEAASRTLANVISNGRTLRVLRRSSDHNDAAAPNTIETAALDLTSPPSFFSTPTKAKPTNNLLRTCLQSNIQRSVGESDSSCGGFDFATGSSPVPPNDDSVIILDDTLEENASDPDVFRFTGRGDNVDVNDDHNNNGGNDSVIIVSAPDLSNADDDDAELINSPENLDDSVCVTRHKVKRVCPITKQPFVFPVINFGACGHTYEKSAITAMIAARRKRGKLCPCPVAGCGSWVWALDLQRV